MAIEIPKNREIIETDEKEFPWVEDKSGYFLVRIKEDEIQCGFVQNNKMVLEIRGKNPDKMIKQIAKNNLVNMEHMGYIASELTRAKECIKNKEEYIQD